MGGLFSATLPELSKWTLPSKQGKVCSISFERPVNYLCDAWHVFHPSTKRGLILTGLELNTNARESFEHC